MKYEKGFLQKSSSLHLYFNMVDQLDIFSISLKSFHLMRLSMWVISCRGFNIMKLHPGIISGLSSKPKP
ncbi:hypothetical protein AHAS_Ahas17G0282000 [Arachis hypogaea]